MTFWSFAILKALLKETKEANAHNCPGNLESLI